MYITACVVAILGFCSSPKGITSEVEKDKDPTAKTDKEMVAVIFPTRGNTVSGTVHFTQLENGQVKVKANFTGLTENSENAFHIHQFGDLTTLDGKSAGGHFNPAGNPHGLPLGEQNSEERAEGKVPADSIPLGKMNAKEKPTEKADADRSDNQVKEDSIPLGKMNSAKGENNGRHTGDLGNIQSDENGNASKTMTVENLTLHGEDSILGRAIIVHEKADTGEQPTGGAGSRIGYGVIGLRNPDK